MRSATRINGRPADELDNETRASPLAGMLRPYDGAPADELENESASILGLYLGPPSNEVEELEDSPAVIPLGSPTGMRDVYPHLRHEAGDSGTWC